MGLLDKIKTENTADRYLPFIRHSDAHMIITRNRGAFQMLKLEGVSFRTADTQLINTLHNQLSHALRNIADDTVMAYVHVGHDCVIGNDCILANQVTLAGHVTVGDHAILGGLSAVHQFCHFGDHAMAGGGSSRITSKSLVTLAMPMRSACRLSRTACPPSRSVEVRSHSAS